jgi:hypothetical protein
MKRIQIFLAIALCTISILFSCKKKKSKTADPEPVSTPITTIVATWTLKEFDEDEDGKFTSTTKADVITFNNDGKYNSDFSYYKFGDITAGNDDSGAYNQTTDSLILKSISGNNVRAKLVKLSPTELWFKWKRYPPEYLEVHLVR